MQSLIEPNIHPLFVHFVVAFLFTSPILLLTAAMRSSGARRNQTIQAAGDWMLVLGAGFALIAVVAGLQAYYSVDHDAPSHAAMTIHRNMAFVTVGIIAVFAYWRWTARSTQPSKLFGILFLAASLAVAATAWKGGQLVYHFGLGVSSLPSVAGDGHDHDHGDNAETTNEGDATGDDHMDDGHEQSVAAASVAATTDLTEASSTDYPDTPEGVIETFAAALRSGDETTVRNLLAPNVIIAEGGGAERSVEEYAGHHMPADMAFTAAVDWTMKKRDQIIDGNMATIITESQIHGTFNDKKIHSRMMESMVLVNSDGQWRIAHIHWSSAPIKGGHEH